MRTLTLTVVAAALPLLAAAQPAKLAPLTPAETAIVKRISEKIATWGHDPLLVAAARAQNERSRKVTDAERRRVDASWQSGGEQGLAQEEMRGDCASRLRQLIEEGSYKESFLMDDHGANVCITNRTSYYWRGEMPKFRNAFAGRVFIDEPKWDESAKARLVQISVPVIDGGHPIGVLTVGVNVDALRRR